MCFYEGDLEHPEFYNEEHRVARKSHVCCECGSEIGKGERYHVATGKWDWEVMAYKTCRICEAVRDKALAHGECVPFGYLWEVVGGKYEDIEVG